MNLDDRLSNIEERLRELEEWTRKDEDKVHEKLKDLDESYQGLSAELRYVMYLKERLEKLEDMQSAMLTMPNVVWTKYRKSPHKCPVCDGFGSPSINERTAPAPREYYREINRCHSCDGKGFVWD